MPRQIRSKGKVVERIENICEYKIDPDGSLTKRMPTYEVREFDNGSQAAYFIYEDGRVFSSYPRNSFWELDSSSSLFRFRSNDDEKNREQIRLELLRRAEYNKERAKEHLAKAEYYENIASKI